MRSLSVTEWRSQLGALRQSSDPVVIQYRHRPAAIMVPVPPKYWEGETSDRYATAALALRDEHLQAPPLDEPHPWLASARQMERLSIDDGARRGSARLFGKLARNIVVILTFYQYANAVMVPLPTDLPAGVQAQLEAAFSAFVSESLTQE